ncbi:MAG: hypothetical protein K0B05_03825 [Bacteroidales bacterium]|nr:hypothetical protein [Bacteroidales bacterium]
MVSLPVRNDPGVSVMLVDTDRPLGKISKGSIENPDVIKPEESTMPFSGDMAYELEPWSVIVVETMMK